MGSDLLELCGETQLWLGASIEVEDTAENQNAMRVLKETLKVRFEQLDIWITAHRIDII